MNTLRALTSLNSIIYHRCRKKILSGGHSSTRGDWGKWTVCNNAPSRGVWGYAPPRIFKNFRCSENTSDALSGHSWLSTNMIEVTTFLMVIRYLTPTYTPSYTGADKHDVRVAVLQLESINRERK